MSKREGRNERKLAEFAKQRGRAKAVSDVNIDARRNFRREAYYQPKNMQGILERFNNAKRGDKE